MALILIALLLSQEPDECQDRRPGLSKCIEYKHVGPGEWTCKAGCYTRKKGKGWDDGGTDGNIVYGSGVTKDECKASLDKQAANGCKP